MNEETETAIDMKLLRDILTRPIGPQTIMLCDSCYDAVSAESMAGLAKADCARCGHPGCVNIVPICLKCSPVKFHVHEIAGEDPE